MGLGMQLSAGPPISSRRWSTRAFGSCASTTATSACRQHFDHPGCPTCLAERCSYRVGLPVRGALQRCRTWRPMRWACSTHWASRGRTWSARQHGRHDRAAHGAGAPQRVLSLASIMSSSGARKLPGPQAATCCAPCCAGPQSRTRRRWSRHYMRLFRLIGSPGLPAGRSRRCASACGVDPPRFHPAGHAAADGSRSPPTARRAESCARIASPTLVLHGKDDPLVPFACGQDTARRIPRRALRRHPRHGP